MDYSFFNQCLIGYVAGYPGEYNQINIWRTPNMACAPVDDRFDRLRKITVADHALSEDLLTGARTVVVWFIPFKPHLQADTPCIPRPSLSWGRAYLSPTT